MQTQPVSPKRHLPRYQQVCLPMLYSPNFCIIMSIFACQHVKKKLEMVRISITPVSGLRESGSRVGGDAVLSAEAG
eukprot:IDg6650t1